MKPSFQGVTRSLITCNLVIFGRVQFWLVSEFSSRVWEREYTLSFWCMSFWFDQIGFIMFPETWHHLRSRYRLCLGKGVFRNACSLDWMKRKDCKRKGFQFFQHCSFSVSLSCAGKDCFYFMLHWRAGPESQKLRWSWITHIRRPKSLTSNKLKKRNWLIS